MSDASGESTGGAPSVEAPAEVDPGARPARYFAAGPLLLLVLAVVVVACDQVTKVLAVAHLEGHPPVSVVGDTVRLMLLRNSGAAFSLGTGFTVVLGVLSAAVVVAICWFARTVHSRWWAWGLGLVLGGAAGNLLDRLLRTPGALRGHVVDFVSVGWWPVFNVADSCLVAGVITIAVAVLLGESRDGTREEATDRG